MKKMSNKGFSLVELIIVIAIMAILVGVLAPQYLKYVEKSRHSADADTLDSLYTACTTAASDPSLQNVPTTAGSVSWGSATQGGTNWTDEVYSTLGITNQSDFTSKLKSKSCKNQTPSISVDANGNFTVSCGDIKIPE